MDAASHAHHPIKSRGGLNFTSFMHWNSTSCNSVWHAPRPCLYMDCLVLDLHREIHSHIPLHLWNQLWRSIESQHYPQQNSTWTYRAQWNAMPTCLLCGVHMCSCVQMSCKVNLQHQILCWGSQIRDLQGCITYGDPYQSLGHLAVFTFCSVESNSTNYWRQRQGSESGTIWNYVASSKANQCLYCWEASGSKRKTTVGRLYMIYMYMYLHVSMNIYY